MPRVFISYRRSDSSTMSGRIYDHLVRAFNDGNVFKDVYDIPAGSDFRKVIEASLQRCNVQLVIIGPGWLDARQNDARRLDDPNDFVRIEVETGLNCADIVVIPVLVSGAQIPAPDHLPESLRNLTYRNAVVIRDDPDFRGDINNLIKTLRRFDVQRTEGVVRRRLPALAVIGVLALVIGVAMVYTHAQDQVPQINISISTRTAIVRQTAMPTTVLALPTAAATPLVTSPAATDAAGESATTLIQQGDAQQGAGDYQSAYNSYTQAIALDPTDAEAYISRASAGLTLGMNSDTILKDANQAIQLDPSNYWNYDELGKVYYTFGDYTSAISAYTHALNLQPYALGYYERGQAYHAQQDYAHAITDLTQAIQLDPNNPDPYDERGWTEIDANQPQDAIADFSAAIKLDSSVSDYYVGRGVGYRSQGDFTDAFADLNQAIALDPQSAEAYDQRGYTYQATGQNDQARADYQQALQNDDNYSDAHLQLADLDLNVYNDPAAALVEAQRAEELATDNPDTHALLGDVYYALGRKQDALTEYQTYAQLAGANAEAGYLARINELQKSE